MDQGIVEFIGHGGTGSEAQIRIELRTQFPGLGGTLVTKEGVVAALRLEHNAVPKEGHRMFLRHTLIKKIEDFFYRTGVYVFAHIPRPLGSLSAQRDGQPVEAYLYEWVFGLEGFPWELVGRDGRTRATHLRDWRNFTIHFAQAGIDLAQDCTDPDDARVSKNIIHQHAPPYGGAELSSLWKRIDFGPRSARLDVDKLSRFLHEQRHDLIRVLRSERYEMLLLGLEYLVEGPRMRELDVGRLEVLLGDYRHATLTQYAMGSGPTHTPAYFGLRTESLI